MSACSRSFGCRATSGLAAILHPLITAARSPANAVPVDQFPTHMPDIRDISDVRHVRRSLDISGWWRSDRPAGGSLRRIAVSGLSSRSAPGYCLTVSAPAAPVFGVRTPVPGVRCSGSGLRTSLCALRAVRTPDLELRIPGFGLRTSDFGLRWDGVPGNRPNRGTPCGTRVLLAAPPRRTVPAFAPGSVPAVPRPAAGRPLRPSRRWLPVLAALPRTRPRPCIHAPHVRERCAGVVHVSAVTLGDGESCPPRGRHHRSHRSLSGPRAAWRAVDRNCGALRGRAALGRLARRMAGGRGRSAALLVRRGRLRRARRAPRRTGLGRARHGQRDGRPPPVEQESARLDPAADGPYVRGAGRARDGRLPGPGPDGADGSAARAGDPHPGPPDALLRPPRRRGQGARPGAAPGLAARVAGPGRAGRGRLRRRAADAGGGARGGAVGA